MNTSSNNLTVFLDNIGRTIIGTSVSETDAVLSVENPALVHIQPSPQSGQLQLQILPLFFKEFQADKSASTTWDFKKCNITQCKPIEFHNQFFAQYMQLFASPPAPPEPEVVKLFDE